MDVPIQPLGFAIFAKFKTGEYCPYYFSEIAPDGMSQGTAHVYLRRDYPCKRLAEIVDTRLSYHRKHNPHDKEWEDWFSSLEVRAVPLTSEQQAALLHIEMNDPTRPECYRGIWVEGWRTPAEGLTKKTFNLSEIKS